MLFSGPWTERYEKKYVLVGAQLLIIISTAILPFANTPDKYWSLAFPAFIIGATGGSLLFVNANIAIFQSTPKDIAGTIGAIFNSALQLGSAVGVAVITSIQLGVDGKHRHGGEEVQGAERYAGRAAGFWFLLAVVALETLAVAVLYRTTDQLKKQTDEERLGSDDATLAEPADEKEKAISGLTTPAAPLSRSESRVESAPTSVDVAAPAPVLLRADSRRSLHTVDTEKASAQV